MPKDVGSGLYMAREMEVPMPFVALAYQMFSIAQATAFGSPGLPARRGPTSSASEQAISLAGELGMNPTVAEPPVQVVLPALSTEEGEVPMTPTVANPPVDIEWQDNP